MGALFSKKPSPATALEKIALEIGDYKQQIQLLGERRATALFYFTILTFLLSSVLNAQMYLQFDYPKNLLIVTLVLVSSIICILIGRNIIYRIYQWRVNRNSQKLEHAVSQKAVLLDLVKETLSFKEAKEILDRYETEEKIEKKDGQENHSAPASPMIGTATPRRERAVTPKGLVTPQGPRLPPNVASSARPPLPTDPRCRTGPNVKQIRPYLRQAGVLDRLLDIVMSDGPENRMALICAACHTHNGMATAAEYPFISYRCFECSYSNAAKKMVHNKPISGLTTSHSAAGSLNKSTSSEETTQEKNEDLEETVLQEVENTK